MGSISNIFNNKQNPALGNTYSLQHSVGCNCSVCSSSEEPKTEILGESAPPSTNSQLGVLANYLSNEFWSDAGQTTRKWNLTNSGANYKNGVITYNTGPNWYDSTGISSGRRTLVSECFKLFEATLGIDFQSDDTLSSDIDFRDYSSGAYAFNWGNWFHSTTNYGFVGNLDNVRFFNKALSETEVMSLYLRHS